MKIRLLLFFSLILQLSWAQNFGLQFDGADDALTLCHNDNFNIGDGFTIEAWVFAREWRAESWQGSIVNKDRQGPDSGFAFRAGKNGTLSFVMSADGIWNEAQTNPIMNSNQWYHVAVVVKDATINLYVNGELMNSGLISGTPTPNTMPLTIGASPGFPGRGWDGSLDEIRVWNIARTTQEISDNQMTSFTGNEMGLVAYLPMNEGASTETANLVDNSCPGTFTNMDESAWGDGYSVPASDVGVVSINAPDVISLFERPVKVNVTIQNYGSEAISNVPVELTVNGLPTLTETFFGSLNPGETTTFTFTQPLSLTGNNTNLLSAKTKHPEDNNLLNDGISYRYKRPSDDNYVSILNEEQHNFGSAGQKQFTPVNFPKNMEDYEQLLLHISVECPNSGCDPWDQPASFSVETSDGEVYEIARFITPYGIECGPWTIDVTDFKSIMQGEVIFQSFVQVWGASGWLVNVDLELVKGDTPRYQRINKLWESDNWVYGDPSVNDDDLPEQAIAIANHTQTSHMRMTISGHGQGNTDNAAEFSNKTHDIMVNGSLSGTHNLWKGDCAQNPCANQAGNWRPNRAGWCPGQQVIPFIYNLTGDMTPGSPLRIDYELEDYTNLLNTGYNNGSHTEPHYRIHSYLVEQSDQRYEEYTNLKADNIEVGTNGNPASPAYQQVVMNIRNTGTEAISGATVAYFVNDVLAFEETLSQTIAPGSSYTHFFSQVNGFVDGEDHHVFGVVTAAGDENLSDDVVATFIDDQLVDIDEINELAFKVSPNPSNGQFFVQIGNDFLRGQLEVVDVQGRIVSHQIIDDIAFDLQLNRTGLFLLRVTSREGQVMYRKLIVH